MKIKDERFFSKKKVFVTGGSGFIGTHLVKKLVSLGAIVGTYVHSSPSEYGIISGSLSTENPDRLYAKLIDFRPDIVFHLAANPLVNYAKEELADTFGINVIGTFNLFDACRRVPSIQSIVHIATDKVYGNIPLITSKSIPNGVMHPYNATKLCGDVIAQMFSCTYGLPVAVIRNGNIYGNGDTHFERIVPRTIKRVLHGYSPIIRGNGSSLRDYIHVDDIVIGWLNASDYAWGRELPTIFNLGAEYPIEVKVVVDTILKYTGRIDIVPTFEPELLQNEIPNQHISDDESQRKIDWSPNIDFETGIERAIQWYKGYIDD